MTINGLLAKVIFDRNPDREFFLEESIPIDWMYPHLVPHKLILRVNREPLPELSDQILQQDHEYWRNTIRPMIGDWLNEETPIQEVTTFATNVFAFRQAFALCPNSPDAVSRYAKLLEARGQVSDAILIAETAVSLDPDNEEFRALTASLREQGRATPLLPKDRRILQDPAK